MLWKCRKGIMWAVLKRIWDFPIKVIPKNMEGWEYRYLSVTNRLYAWALILVSLGVIANLLGQEEFNLRLKIAIAYLVIYPICFKLKLYQWARFSVVAMGSITSFYGPWLLGQVAPELHFRIAFQNIMYLLVGFWAVHPKFDRLQFMILVLMQFPLVVAGVPIVEWIVPGSMPELIRQNLFIYTIGTGATYILFMVSGFYLVNQRENTLDSLSLTNKKLLEIIEENEVVSRDLKKQLDFSDEKIDHFLKMNSHDLRLPVSNLKGLIMVIRNDVKLGKANLSRDLIEHLSSTAELLDDKIIAVNEKLENDGHKN